MTNNQPQGTLWDILLPHKIKEDWHPKRPVARESTRRSKTASSDLCTSCVACMLQIGEDTGDGTQSFSHDIVHRRLLDIMTSSKSNQPIRCVICTRISERIAQFPIQEAEDISTLEVIWFVENICNDRARPITISFRVQGRNGDQDVIAEIDRAHLRLFKNGSESMQTGALATEPKQFWAYSQVRNYKPVSIWIGEDDRWVHVSDRHKLQGTESAVALRLFAEWLQSCQDRHELCQSLHQAKPDWRPTRLLKIFSNGREVSLVKSSELPEGTPYVSLSHCWGLVEPDRLILKNANKVELESGISITRLTRTFQDALSVVHQLGFAYIWIDSLCIVQDSLLDWQTESTMMGKVYQHSIFNIFAMAAEDDNQSFLNARDPRTQLGFRLNLQTIGEEYEGDGLATTEDGLLFQHDMLFRWETTLRPIDSRTGARLYTRAWVYQEDFLAFRTLTFAKDLVWWSCPSTIASERSLDDAGIFERYKIHNQRSDYEWQSDENFKIHGDYSSKLHEEFYNLVNDYATTDLTKAQDRLIAFSAIAAEMSRVTDCRYLAGLWEKNLVHQLVWSVRKFAKTPLMQDYVAPSWSWASVNVPINVASTVWSKKDKISLADVIDADVEPVVEGFPYGQLRGGYLRLSGQLIPVISQDIAAGTIVLSNGEWQHRAQLWADRDPSHLTKLIDTGRCFACPLSLDFNKEDWEDWEEWSDGNDDIDGENVVYTANVAGLLLEKTSEGPMTRHGLIFDAVELETSGQLREFWACIGSFSIPQTGEPTIKRNEESFTQLVIV